LVLFFEEPFTFHPRIKFARSEQFQQWFIAAAPGEVAPMLREWISDIIDIKIHEARLPVSQFLFAEIAAKRSLCDFVYKIQTILPNFQLVNYIQKVANKYPSEDVPRSHNKSCTLNFAI